MKQTLRNFLPFVFTSLLLVTILPAVAASESEGNKHPVWGTVKDTNGVPLVGVSVVVVGTHSGVNTDIKGTFRIIVADGATLRFSYIGYEPQELKIKPDRVGYDITLKEQSTDIGQVVVTGFAKTEIRKSTGSVAVIEGKDLKTSPLEGVDKLLQGKLAGVSVQSVSGRPGEAVKIRIRGTSTITAMPNRCGSLTAYRCRRRSRHLLFPTRRFAPETFRIFLLRASVGSILTTSSRSPC